MEFSDKKSLSNFGFTFKKMYGQNFLKDETLLNSIVEKSGVDKTTTVLEIGCGAGALTEVLCKTAKRVIGYEIDTTLKPVLTERLSKYNNVEIVYKDVMKESVEKIENGLGEYVIVANLPYYITTPIITKFLEQSKTLKSMSIMVQEEVANRLSAKQSTSDYGAITVAIDLRGSAKIIERVGREKFTPSPNVDSAVVKIDIDKNKNKNINFDSVRKAVKLAFNNRRKMLVNNIMQAYKTNRESAESILQKINVPITARGETLSAEQFVALSTELEKYEK